MDILKLPFTLFNAIDGEMLDKSYQENKSLSDLGLDQRIKMNLDKTGSYVNANNLNINWGSVGKWLSHLTLYLEIMDNHKNDEAILILEDDVVIDRDFKKKFKDFLNDVPSNWEFLALGFCGNKSHKIKKSVYKIDKMSCSHAYILRGSKVAEKMFNHLNDEVAKVIDINWMRLFDGKMESYHIWPILISQRKTYASDVNQTSFYIKEVNNPL